MDRYETVVRDAIEKVYPGWSAPAKECVGRALADLIREQFPEPGRCGECRWWDSPQNPRDDEAPLKCCRCTNPQRDTHGIWTLQDFSCPRFKPKPDAYEELAREFRKKFQDTIRKAMDGGVARIDEDDDKLLAAFLRERVTVREGT